MHRLFWKLFLSFWATLILFSVAVMLSVSVYIDHLHKQQNTTAGSESISQHIARAQAKANAHGIEGLSNWARDIDRKNLVPVLVLNDAGHDLLGREVSPRALGHLRRHLQLQNLPDERPIPVIHMANGEQFWLVPDFESVTIGRFLSRPRVITFPLLIATFVGALVCLFLARYLAAPIERLRHAAQDYAGGDFSYRVGPSLGRRRDEIVDLAFALDDMAERLDTLIGSQRHFLRDVSHELRSPLARVHAALGLARQRAGNIITPELDRIEREADCLNELIGKILSLSRLETGVSAPRRELIDLAQLLQEVVEDSHLEAHAKACAIELAPLPPASVEGDPALLHSAIENVLRNAIRHTVRESSVSVTLAVQPTNDGNTCVIRIADHGPGVPEPMLHKIFEPFVRVSEARDRESGGYGLGLAIAHRAIRAHHGEIKACNRATGGLEVTIRLPSKSG